MTFIIHSRKHGDHEVLIDDADAESVLKYKWQISKHLRKKVIYARRSITVNGSRRQITLHKQLTGFKLTDHINENGLDCRRENLSDATVSQNNLNRGTRRDNTSGYKGVSWDRKLSKWRSRITADRKKISVGYFPSPELAAIAYNQAAIKYHGEFAKLNEVRI